MSFENIAGIASIIVLALAAFVTTSEYDRED